MMQGPVCRACTAEVMFNDMDFCLDCIGRVMVAHKCPHCEVVRSYFGGQAPSTCGSCRAILPDLNDIIRSRLARVDYHLDKEIY